MTPKQLMSAATIIATTFFALGCSKRESSNGALAHDSGTAAASPSESGDSIVRGTVVTVNDSTLTLSSPNGDVHIVLTPPVAIYTRRPADLSRVTDNSFVGVTSLRQPDGTQRATEIHIFPEELRGLGEGSRPMSQSARASTMTNGSVENSRMTNGMARMTNGAARMTNGTARGTARGSAGGTITVQYNGGSQTITVPADVTVTEIARTTTKPTAGASVIVLAAKQPDGTLKASRVMLAGK